MMTDATVCMLGIVLRLRRLIEDFKAPLVSPLCYSPHNCGPTLSRSTLLPLLRPTLRCDRRASRLCLAF
jgi:hypothetical protein